MQQLRGERIFTTAKPGRPDSPRPRPDKVSVASSRPWSRYPPRTAETRNARHQYQNPLPLHRHPQLRPAPVCKQVSFHGVPSSSSISGRGAIRLTGPAREHRRQQRLAARSKGWVDALRACVSATWGSSKSSLPVPVVAGVGGEPRRSRSRTTTTPRGSIYMHAQGAVSAVHLGVEEPAATSPNSKPAAARSPTQMPAPASLTSDAHQRRHSNGSREPGDGNPPPPSPSFASSSPPARPPRSGGNGPPYPVPQRKYSLLSAAVAAALGHRQQLQPCRPRDGPERSERSVASRKMGQLIDYAGEEIEGQRTKRRYWV